MFIIIGLIIQEEKHPLSYILFLPGASSFINFSITYPKENWQKRIGLKKKKWVPTNS